MNRKQTGIVLLACMVIMTSGCATQGAQSETLISAAEFEEMIRIEVRDVEPMLTDEIVAAAETR